jgi:hypothetical protein
MAAASIFRTGIPPRRLQAPFLTVWVNLFFIGIDKKYIPDMNKLFLRGAMKISIL